MKKIVLQDNEVRLRLLEDTEEDYHCLKIWYQNDFVYNHFEQRKLNYEELKNKYKSRTSIDSQIPVFMILYNELPIGIIQFQLVSKNNLKLYKLNGENVYEIDLFIGINNFHNRGIGTKVIKLLLKYLYKYKNANQIVMCPKTNNFKAINCYKKCGFIEKDTFITEDTIGEEQEYLLMVKVDNNANNRI